MFYYERRSNDSLIFLAVPTKDVESYLKYKFQKPDHPLPEVGIIPGTNVNGYWWNFPNGGSLVGVVGKANNELMQPYVPPIKKSNTFGNVVADFNAYGGAKNKKKHTKRRRKASRRKASRRKASRRKASRRKTSRSRRGGTSQMYYGPKKVPYQTKFST
jgi:flavin-dependent dehydrogenase